MQKLLEFFKDWLNTRWERKNYCKSCEILRIELDSVKYERKLLLDKFVLVTQHSETVVPDSIEAIKPKMIPWRVQRELLEAEDRAKAQAIRRQQEDLEKAKVIESNSLSVAELEKELGVQ